jgi:hypothetical protein
MTGKNVHDEFGKRSSSSNDARLVARELTLKIGSRDVREQPDRRVCERIDG